MNLLKKCLAEFIGTAVLVLVGCGVAAITGCNGSINASYILTALAFGLALMGLVYGPTGHLSGCHVNPAISVGKWLIGEMPFKHMAAYVVAQCCGGICGTLVLMGLIGRDFGLSANSLYGGSIVKSILIEAILTCIFASTVLGVTDQQDDTPVAGLVVGGALSLVHLFGIPLTGTSVNPARSIGPALLMGGESLKALPVFLVGPLLGSVMAAGLFVYFKDGGTNTKPMKTPDGLRPRERDFGDIFTKKTRDAFVEVDDEELESNVLVEGIIEPNAAYHGKTTRANRGQTAATVDAEIIADNSAPNP